MIHVTYTYSIECLKCLKFLAHEITFVSAAIVSNK